MITPPKFPIARSVSGTWHMLYQYLPEVRPGDKIRTQCDRIIIVSKYIDEWDCSEHLTPWNKPGAKVCCCCSWYWSDGQLY